MKKFSTRQAMLSAMLMTAACGFTAVAADNSQSKLYRLPRITLVKAMRPYTNTLYTAGNHDVSTMRGHFLHKSGKDTIRSFEVNPAGFSFAIVEKGKKDFKAGNYSTTAENKGLSKFNVKKYGNPVALCFTPDARNMIVATDKAMYLCDARTMEPQERMGGSLLLPDYMTVSPTGQLMAAISGDKCVVYNMETKQPRKTLDPGAPVTDVQFSPDGQDLAVLTDDGVLTVYSTRSLEMRKMIDDLGQGLAFTYNFDGKYVAVATAPDHIDVVNLLNPSDREEFNPVGGVTDVAFITDADNNTMMAYNTIGAVEALRLYNLKPYYNKLINDEVEGRMADWLKMMPGETMDEYRARVSDESRNEQRRMFEYEITTKLAGNLLGGAAVSLGSYDRANGVLAVTFESMPTIFLPVPENEVTAFGSAADIVLDDVLFGVNPDDSFEIVYAAVTNRNNGKQYVFDNKNRATMNFMASDDAISIEALQQQQMEELRLQEVREQVLREAKQSNVISDNTNITVDSRIVPDYDGDGNKILNYLVTFTYDVAPGFSATEDFGPGKYHVGESGAATSMLKIVEKAFEGDLKQYIGQGKKVRVTLTGTADATPIVRGIPYDGSYGEFDNEPVYVDGQLSALTVDSKTPMKENPQLAFVRAMGVRDWLEKNIDGFKNLDKDYRYEVNVSKDKGSEFRRITAAFTFINAF